ncbi:MAG: nucleotidyltransferase family protein [Verrucomicrobiae bacterium]|nr:nucleotidyltransferase family protein [Verrucomicrobiae bacterium]MCX7722450.1 nucleotidyltransferase family protein [Verrucomicrobiae bacterium]MDW7980983.1 nucleotidyltransferase family protein [Verrucomicrobiales bacterium]
MKAVILAAGKGTRMRHLTADMPKPMLQVRGRPVLEYVVNGIVAAGIRELFIVTGYRAEVIETHFGDGARFGAQIVYGRQLIQDGTGKAVEIAKGFLGTSPFLLIYGDILVQPETYRHAIERFQLGDVSAVIAARHGEDVTKGGLLIFDEKFELKRVLEKPSDAQLTALREAGMINLSGPLWYNAGIYVFSHVLFEFTARLEKSPRGEFELTDALNAMLHAGHRIAGVEVRQLWLDVRDPEALAEAERLLS